MVFVDLENARDRVPMELLCMVEPTKENFPEAHIRIIQDVYG